MGETRFYHLSAGNIVEALARLCGKALSQGRRVVIRLPDEAAAEKITQSLWNFSADSFLPHGNAADGEADRQPVWITHRDENPNGADVLIAMQGAEFSESPDAFALICALFDGRDDADLSAARARWKACRNQSEAPDAPGAPTLTYWQQAPTGEWEKKA
ncbi:MAG: DNA polymerase III subunit chi [Rhodospirillales bacterium]|nr:DNA polymerase III subunit chi [Rhodospirillales bacterium]